jgi:hypothetical protein
MVMLISHICYSVELNCLDIIMLNIDDGLRDEDKTLNQEEQVSF